MPIRRFPQRRCVACGTARAKRDLVRIVRTPAGEVCVDLTGKMSGRGAYVCPDATCVDRAIGQGRLAGALERAISEDVARQIREAASLPPAPRAPVVRRISLSRQDGEHGSPTKPAGHSPTKPAGRRPLNQGGPS
jgi:predicted RNA-binding protein YlxR (DUF448 family)